MLQHQRVHECGVNRIVNSSGQQQFHASSFDSWDGCNGLPLKKTYARNQLLHNHGIQWGCNGDIVAFSEAYFVNITEPTVASVLRVVLKQARNRNKVMLIGLSNGGTNPLAYDCSIVGFLYPKSPIWLS